VQASLLKRMGRTSQRAGSLCAAYRSSKAGDDGRTPGPGSRKCTVYRHSESGGLPLALRLSEESGVTDGVQVLLAPSGEQCETRTQ
jgi:hypothetical protein